MDGWTLSNRWISCRMASELLMSGWGGWATRIDADADADADDDGAPEAEAAAVGAAWLWRCGGGNWFWWGFCS